jgi:hypothetical protein
MAQPPRLEKAGNVHLNHFLCKAHVTRKASQHRILIPVSEIIKTVGATYNFVDSVALTDQCRVLDAARLDGPSIGSLSRNAILSVQLGLAFLFDIR